MSRRAWIGAALFAVVCALLITLASCKQTPEQSGSMLLIVDGDRSGSAVYIGNGMVLTAAHVLGNPPAVKEPVKLTTDQGHLWEGSIAWVAPAYDVALVRVPGIEDVASAPQACRLPRADEEVTAEGNPILFQFIRTWGHVASATIEERGDWKETIIFDLTTAIGSSGGPIYDADGAVVGIVVGNIRVKDMGVYPYTIAVPSSTICALLGRKVS